jgi:hypothetical protein
MSTTVIKRISVSDYGTVIPSPFAWPYDAAALVAGGWFPIGSRDNGDSADINSDAIKIKPLNEGSTINPPGSQTAQGFIKRKGGIKTVGFSAYDVAREIWALDSCVAANPTSGIPEASEVQGVQTYRSLLVEFENGEFMHWYPKVLLSIIGETGGYGPGDAAVCTLEFEADVFGVAPSCVSGRLRIENPGFDS